MTSAYSPVKPPKLEPDHVYLQISYTSPDPLTTPLLQPASAVQVKYVGPVGELKGEGIFQVMTRDGGIVKRGEDLWQRGEQDVVQQIKKVDGVKTVKVIPELKRRAKRDEI
ncbi:hypothetical protein IAR55_003964 [Kwoniella newhampshirensis]|uniref:Uncharacterized protein n=1 Tax=Kwoniella newhampshirensis TaxID=1651941 RepID=A0AAW0YYK9_9TREE